MDLSSTAQAEVSDAELQRVEQPQLSSSHLSHPQNEQFIVANTKIKPSIMRRVKKEAKQRAIDKLRSGFKLSTFFPIVSWLPKFISDRPGRRILSDIVCGVTVAAFVVPQGMAFGRLAGLPAVYGLYTALLPPVAYAFLGTSMHLSVGPFALVSMLTAQGISLVVPHPNAHPAAAIAAASVLALTSGLILLALGFLRLGFIATLLSDPVLSGFITAASIIIPCTQWKYALQLNVPRGNFVQTIYSLVSELFTHGPNYYALCLFTFSIVCILLIQALNSSERLPLLKKFPLPAELIVVILATLICWAFDLGSTPTPGVSLLGEIPPGLPSFRFPDMRQFDFGQILQASLMISLMTYVTSMSAAKNFGRKFGYEVDNNQELIALGFSNVVGSLSSSYPAASSLSRSAVVGASGASSPLHNLWTSVILVLVLLFAGPLLQPLPDAALAAIITMAFKTLLLNGIDELRMCWRVSATDCVMWVIAFNATLWFDVTIGIVISVAADVMFLFFQSTMPTYSVLGRLEGTERIYRSCMQFTEAVVIEGIMIFRFDAPLHFANREVFLTTLSRELRAHDTLLNTEPGRDMSGGSVLRNVWGECMSIPEQQAADQHHHQKKKVTTVLIDLSPMSHIDMSAIRALLKLRQTLYERGTRLVLAHCKFACYQKLDDMGMFKSFGDSRGFDVVCFRELHDAVLFAEGRLTLASSKPLQVIGDACADEMQCIPSVRTTTEVLEEQGIAVGPGEVGEEFGNPCNEV
jgi:high affinity sulfate transporter 1